MGERRALNDILDDAVEVINPPAPSRAAFRALVMENIERLRRGTRRHMRRRQLKINLEKYARALRVAQNNAAAVKNEFPAFMPDMSTFDEHWDGDFNFADLLDDELTRVEELLESDFFDNFAKGKGCRPKDLDAQVVVCVARDLIDHDFPWRRKPTLTASGPWLRLSTLLYEAITGRYDREMSKYCREWRPPEPVREWWGERLVDPKTIESLNLRLGLTKDGTTIVRAAGKS